MKPIIFAILSLILAGCAAPGPSKRLGHFTAASTFNVRGFAYDQRSAVKVSGEDCVRMGAISNDSRIQRAMDNAIRTGQLQNPDADLLVNVRIDQTYPVRYVRDIIFPINIPTSFDCIEVSGDLVKLK